MLVASHRRWLTSSKQNRRPAPLGVEGLEDRDTPSTFLVTSLADGGPGSLRQAILDANAARGADQIGFTVAGTIQLTSGALPAITDRVDIDGSPAATSFAGPPVVEVDFNGFDGLHFIHGADGSALRSLGLIRAGGNGVTIDGADGVTVAGNFIGVGLDGVTPAGNSGDGVALRNTQDDLIGHSDPVTGVDYYTTGVQVGGDPVNGWQGIRNSDTSGQYLISATAGSNGVLYDGPITGDSPPGTVYPVNYPNPKTIATSVYGPDNLPGDDIRLVGTYRNIDYATAPVTVHGFLFEGKVGDLANPDNYTTIDHPHAQFNYVHSTMGGLAVGNYDSQPDHGNGKVPLGPGHAFLYDIAQGKFLTDIVFPHSKSNTAYGIWYNGGTSYTICGGYSPDVVNNFDDQSHPIGQGYLVDYDSATGQFSNWASFSYPNGVNFVTHFEGISSVEKGVYTLSADSNQIGSGDPSQGSWVSVRRNADGSFGPGTWVDLNYPNGTTNLTSSNSVYGNQVVGLAFESSSSDSGNFAYQATVNTGFQLSNVISGNGGNGISLDHATDNQIAMNYIGTDVTGTLDRGNGQNGILVTGSSVRNLIGGEATGGNDPTSGTFVRPPQGNLISGNDADGVLITGRASANQLSGNFIGTRALGDTALGNALDGVAIDGADNNRLIGCTVQNDPFVFYNVIGGNGGNGLRVTNSNNTTIQANFFGLGADNKTPVGNALNGVVVGGTSNNTVFGGVIPLGNVASANGQNGVVVKDKASGFLAFNTFAGTAAFTQNPLLGNTLDGFLITATGGNNVLRTNVISRNGDDGVEISGDAHGVQVVQNIIGLATDGTTRFGNGGNGVEIGGTAHDNVIGGPQPSLSVIAQNAISANHGHGVAVVGNAHDNSINFSYIGLDLFDTEARGNDGSGVFLGAGTSATTIGSTDRRFLTVVSGNGGAGIEMQGSSGNTVIGTLIGTAADGSSPVPNLGDGIHIAQSSNNVIGGTGSGQADTIAFNSHNGVFVESGQRNAIRANSIHDNLLLGILVGPGANNNQPAPVLTSAVTVPRGIQVTGTIVSTPNTWVTIDVFANTTSDPSGFGEGRFYLGSVRVKTKASGFAGFAFLGPLPPAGANFLTATATDDAGNTSGFSQSFSL